MPAACRRSKSATSGDFPRHDVESWLKTRNGVAPSSAAGATGETTQAVEGLRKLLPLECVQLIQNTFADVLGVMVLITDLDGEPVTEPSNPCGLFTAAESSPEARKRCMQLWAELARDPAMQPQFIQSHVGLLCARGLIRVGSELKAMLVVGGIAPEQWPPSDQQLARIAADLQLPEELLRRHIDDVFVIARDEQKRLLAFVQRIADIVSHIIQERNQFYSTLHHIAALTKI